MTSDSRCTSSSSSSWLASARFPTWASNESVPASVCHDDGTEPLDLHIQPILNYSHDTLLLAGNHKVISPNVSLVFNTCCLAVTPCPLPSIPFNILQTNSHKNKYWNCSRLPHLQISWHHTNMAFSLLLLLMDSMLSIVLTGHQGSKDGTIIPDNHQKGSDNWV